jgi:23S rRNA (cytosine1962-C5)-methyltransferase
VKKQPHDLKTIIDAAQQRASIGKGMEVLRLFNGFYEGFPGLVIDRFGPAMVVFDHSDGGIPPELLDGIISWAIQNLSGLQSVLLKGRRHSDAGKRKGILVAGELLPDSVTELGVHYAIDLRMNQDAGFYLDTRELRKWLLAHSVGKRVLNTFAYTGSLGVAAGVGGAAHVAQTDLSRKYLRLARKSWALNGLGADHSEIIPGDFFKVTARLRSAERLFDIIILDPPFFSTTLAGRVDLQAGMTRLINKVRPLTAHGGILVVINNALFLSGRAFKAELDRLCQSKYVSFEEIIPIPEDITGYPETIVAPPPADPAPFNHATKTALLRVTRKDGRR